MRPASHQQMSPTLVRLAHGVPAPMGKVLSLQKNTSSQPINC